MTQADSSLHNLCEHLRLVHPYNPENVGPCSIDLTLGGMIRPEGHKGQAFSEAIDMHSAGDYTLEPGERVLANTYEVVNMPRNMVGKLMLRSTAARMGLEHSFSGLIDPCFGGQLTLELKNDLRNHPIVLSPGMRLIQMTVEAISGAVIKGYDRVGWYQGQSGPTVSNLRITRHHRARNAA